MRLITFSAICISATKLKFGPMQWQDKNFSFLQIYRLRVCILGLTLYRIPLRRDGNDGSLGTRYEVLAYILQANSTTTIGQTNEEVHGGTLFPCGRETLFPDTGRPYITCTKARGTLRLPHVGGSIWTRDPPSIS